MMLVGLGRKYRLLVYIAVIVILGLVLIIVPKVTYHLSTPFAPYTRNLLFLQQSSYTEVQTFNTDHEVSPPTEVNMTALETSSQLAIGIGSRAMVKQSPYSELKQGYVAVIRFSGQQGAGVRALQSLQLWASTLSVPMNILEPTIGYSTLVSDLSTDPLKTNSRNSTAEGLFSDLFDMDHFNKRAKDCEMPQIMTMQQFHNKAPKKVVLVWMKIESKNETNQETELARVIWPEDESNSPECFNIQNAKRQWRKYVAKIPPNKYCIVKVVEALYSFADTKIFSQQEARTVIYGQWSPTEVTTVFSLWRAVWSVPMANKKPIQKSCFSPSSEHFEPSKHIINQSLMYEKQHLHGENNLAIMFRLERMIEYLQNSKTDMSITKCLKRVIEISQEIQLKHTVSVSKPYITIDIGESGSSSWEKTLSHFGTSMNDLRLKAEQTISILSHGEWSTIKEWEESFKHIIEGVESPAYIAALQRTLASRADCLVLVGGGLFQNIALKNYLQNHPDEKSQCVHFVCALESITLN